jgi:hypothetical protein
MSDNTPAWLQPNTTEAPAPAADNGGITSVAPPPPPPPDASSAAAAESDHPDLPGLILIMRLVNMGAAVALMTVSVRYLCLVKHDSNFTGAPENSNILFSHALPLIAFYTDCCFLLFPPPRDFFTTDH